MNGRIIPIGKRAETDPMARGVQAGYGMAASGDTQGSECTADGSGQGDGLSQIQIEQLKERRKSVRHAVDEACVMAPLRQGGVMPCQMLNLSLDGCMVRTQNRFHAGIHVRVELGFKLNGIAFRFTGVTRWTDGRHLAGIAFIDVIPRRREALAEALGELEAGQAFRAGMGEQAEREAAEVQVRAGLAMRAELEPEAKERAAGEQNAKPPAPAEAALVQEAETPPATAPAAGPAKKQERRAQQRHPVDNTAIIYMVRAGSQLHGRIQDISASGCRIRTDERFPVGIYTRVETEFHVEGLPFRLAGVIQSIHDKGRFLVGIRFLDMSERKREQLAMLIEEIQELTARRVGGQDSAS